MQCIRYRGKLAEVIQIISSLSTFISVIFIELNAMQALSLWLRIVRFHKTSQLGEFHTEMLILQSFSVASQFVRHLPGCQNIVQIWLGTAL